MVRPDSLRQMIYEEWVKNPYLTAKKICSDHKLDYGKHGNYINKLLSEYRSYHKFASPQEAHLPHRRVFVWEKVEGDRSIAVQAGWKPAANRNGMLVFRGVWGSVHWYKEGLVRLYLRGELTLAHAKELFCRAFSWFTPEQLKKCLDVPLKETERHWVFELGAPMPRFDIRQFERTHGVRIYADGSHPTGLEVSETTPFWIDEQRQATKEFGEVVQKFGEEIQEHLKLIRMWEKEARVRRLKPIIRKPKKEVPAQKSILNWMIG